MIEFETKGDFKKLTSYLEKMKHLFRQSVLDEYGRKGVELLESATPKKTGKTSQSWRYKIEYTKNGAELAFYNDNINDSYIVAILLQYGHMTEDGYYVQGVDYINPVMKPLFDELAEKLWKEVKN